MNRFHPFIRRSVYAFRTHPSSLTGTRHQTTRMSSAADINLRELVSACVYLGSQSGSLIKSIFEGGKFVGVDKSTAENRVLSTNSLLNAEDPQTIADVSAQQMIIGSLRTVFPTVTIRGEEGEIQIDEQFIRTPVLTLVPRTLEIPSELEVIDASRICIWVDPLDGTREFVEGIKEAVTCLIGIAYEGRPIAGVVNRPFSDQTVWGVVGTNTIFGTSLMDGRDTTRRIVVTTRSHFKPAMQSYLDLCQFHGDGPIRSGGAGGKVLMLIEGVADAYVFPSRGTKRWDTCAPEAVLRAVGGKLTDCNGNDYDYSSNIESPQNQDGVIATLFGDEYHASFCGHSS